MSVEWQSLVQVGTYFNNTVGCGWRQTADTEKRTQEDYEGIDGELLCPDFETWETAQVKGLKNKFYIPVETMRCSKGPGKTGWGHTTKAKWLLIESPTHIIRLLFKDFQRWSLPKQKMEYTPTYEGAMGTHLTYRRVCYKPQDNPDEMFCVSYKELLAELKGKYELYPKMFRRDADRKLQLIDTFTR
jgi:hypothetical protein